MRDELVLWHDVRARAIDRKLAGDRLAIGERVVVRARWVFAIAFTGALASRWASGAASVAAVVLVAWTVANLAVWVELHRHWQPRRLAAALSLCADLGLAAVMVLLGLGPSHPVTLAFLLVTVAGATRLGWVAPVLAAAAASLLFGTASGFADLASSAGAVFIFMSLGTVVTMIARELERERRAAVTRAAQADALRELGVTGAASIDLKDVFPAALQHARRLTTASEGGVVVVDREHAEPVAGEVGRTDLVMAVASGTRAPGLVDDRLVVPLATAEGAVAVLELAHGERPFGTDDLARVSALASSLAIPLANGVRFRRSALEAVSDPVTGLANHREFQRRLAAELAIAKERKTPVAVVLLDLDRFKVVNDTMGHQHGDEVLRHTGALVRGTARGHDLVARYGGDELAAVLVDTGAAGAAAFAGRVIDAVHSAAMPAGPGQALTLSLGYGVYPGDGNSAEELVMAADQALYMAKRSGRDRAEAFAELPARLADPAALVSALREAGPQVVVAAGHAIDRGLGTPGRSSGVLAVAEQLLERSGLPADREAVRAAAFLHDLGRVLGGDDHADAGARLLEESGFPAATVAAVREHHERWDGTGPHGLAGEQVPVEARIIAAAADPSAGSDRGAHDPRLLAALAELRQLPHQPPTTV